MEERVKKTIMQVHLTLDVYDEGSLFKFQPHKGFKCLGEEVS